MNIFNLFNKRKRADSTFLQQNLDQPAVDLLTLSHRKIYFLSIFLRDEHLAELKLNLAKTIDLTIANGGYVGSLAGSFLFSCFPESHDLNLKVIGNQIQNSTNGNAKILFGAVPGYFGNIGSNNYMSYGPIFENFTQIFSSLTKLNYGDIQEFILNQAEPRKN
ncbi:hypothetical protein LEP1GSC058_4156 [Leptospira fainei serovar Hurstbridge str. BUT 6]|uniref:Uncharacterized protein n=1 Tax=Leptospira fainei serovar Hurstbridge str. BUT 6 TaxID=1193011 RepID=S3UTR5_9LEPT|nr:hypothetical protein [Leptospira fainei]EPG73821.1 hypothetical protein LEP1GSC058_4156 [Leptospira fainei serovar Hurstbridge str. BUT 6]